MFPLVSPKNLIRLGEDLLHVYPIYCEDRNGTLDNIYIPWIFEVVSKGKASPTGLSSEEANALAGVFREVPLPYKILYQCLTPLVVRLYLDGVMRVPVRTHGPDF